MRARAIATIFGAAALTLGLGAPGKAAVTFTWNPGINSGAGQFTANSYTLQDYAAIDTSDLAHVTETGFLNIAAFNLNGASVNTPVNTAGGYGIYLHFDATSHLASCGANCLKGAFDSVSYTATLYNAANGVASFSFSGTTPQVNLPAGANPLQIATGTGPTAPAGSAENTASIVNGVPGASVETNWVPNPAASGFFISPPAAITLLLEQAFINTPGAITTSGPFFLIGGTGIPGGGNGDFLTKPVPEPAAWSILGLGLVGIGFVRRRRS